MKFEIFNVEQHYEMLLGWWKEQGFPTVPILALPRTGIVIKNENEYIYAMFIYFTGSSIAWVEWIVGNPEAKPGVKRGGIQYGIESLSTIAKFNGADSLFISAKHGGLINSLKKCDFSITDIEMTNLIKKI